MDILLVVRNRLVRDQVKVGLQQFPEFSVTVGEGYAGINELRQRRFDCVFLGLEGQGRDALRLLRQLRSFDTGTEVVAVCAERQARDLQSEKSRLNIAAFLHAPVAAIDFFRLVARFRARRLEAATPPSP